MQKNQFQSLIRQGFNRIPLVREVLADLDTPLSAYLKLANGPYSYLLESVQGGEKWGRYSIIGLPSRHLVRVNGHTIRHEVEGKIQETLESADPLAWIEQFYAHVKVPEIETLPRFTGGLVGYFGHDIIRYIEPKLGPCPNADELETPDILLMVSDEVAVFDNYKGRLYFIVYAENEKQYERALQRLDSLENQLRHTAPVLTAGGSGTAITEKDFISGFTEAGYINAVKKIKDYIVEGDAMQVVLSQRMSVPFHTEPLNLYRALRGLNPSPYMYFMNLGDFHIVGSSPEILVRLEEREVTVRPLAGTRPRGRTDGEDKRYENDLLNDPKELAEHLMLIDLGRNDIGRVCETGSVMLTDKMIIEHYSHVMHIVSNVVGRLKPGLSAMDVLRACFPAGTLSGAPKIRAMEIIDELEPVKRGVYGGAVGYISWSGNMDMAIAIRTAVIKANKLTIQAGAGIVHDSVPELEWQETLNKGRAMFKAVALAEAGFKSQDSAISNLLASAEYKS